MRLSPQTIYPVIGAYILRPFDVEQRALRYGVSGPAARSFKFGITLALMFLAAGAIISWWRMPALLLAVLILLAFLKHTLFPIKSEGLIYLTVALMGPVAESIIILTGGAWSYALPQTFGIPVWLAAIWGLTGIAVVTMYQALIGDGPQEHSAR